MTVYRFALEFNPLFKDLCDGIAAMIIYHTYDMVDELPMGNHSLTLSLSLALLSFPTLVVTVPA